MALPGIAPCNVLIPKGPGQTCCFSGDAVQMRPSTPPKPLPVAPSLQAIAQPVPGSLVPFQFADVEPDWDVLPSCTQASCTPAVDGDGSTTPELWDDRPALQMQMQDVVLTTMGQMQGLHLQLGAMHDTVHRQHAIMNAMQEQIESIAEKKQKKAKPGRRERMRARMLKEAQNAVLQDTANMTAREESLNGINTRNPDAKQDGAKICESSGCAESSFAIYLRQDEPQWSATNECDKVQPINLKGIQFCPKSWHFHEKADECTGNEMRDVGNDPNTETSNDPEHEASIAEICLQGENTEEVHDIGEIITIIQAASPRREGTIHHGPEADESEDHPDDAKIAKVIKEVFCQRGRAADGKPSESDEEMHDIGTGMPIEAIIQGVSSEGKDAVVGKPGDNDTRQIRHGREFEAIATGESAARFVENISLPAADQEVCRTDNTGHHAEVVQIDDGAKVTLPTASCNAAKKPKVIQATSPKTKATFMQWSLRALPIRCAALIFVGIISCLPVFFIDLESYSAWKKRNCLRPHPDGSQIAFRLAAVAQIRTASELSQWEELAVMVHAEGGIETFIELFQATANSRRALALERARADRAEKGAMAVVEALVGEHFRAQEAQGIAKAAEDALTQFGCWSLGSSSIACVIAFVASSYDFLKWFEKQIGRKLVA